MFIANNLYTELCRKSKLSNDTGNCIIPPLQIRIARRVTVQTTVIARVLAVRATNFGAIDIVHQGSRVSWRTQLEHS